MKTYNHGYSLGFAIAGSSDEEGQDVKPDQVRRAILERLAGLDDEDLMEAIGAPYDTYQESKKEQQERKKNAKRRSTTR